MKITLCVGLHDLCLRAENDVDEMCVQLLCLQLCSMCVLLHLMSKFSSVFCGPWFCLICHLTVDDIRLGGSITASTPCRRWSGGTLIFKTDPPKQFILKF